MEIFILYNTETGEIKSQGKVDKSAIQDGHSMLENINRQLIEDTDLAVLYMPDKKLPSKREYIIKNGKLKKQHPNWVPEKERIEALILADIRTNAIQRLIASGADIPQDYV